MPKVGIEPTHPSGYTILSRARLPIPPLRQVRRSITREEQGVKIAICDSISEILDAPIRVAYDVCRFSHLI